MQLDLYTQTLIGFFTITCLFGALANWSNFCTMGAVSDWVNFGDKSRLRSWLVAIAVAVVGAASLEYAGILDLDLTSSNETSTPPYRSPELIWLRHIVGGILFGIGMTLASGCGNKTLVRLGEGNLKSVVVLLAIALSSSLMFFTSFDYVVFLQWMVPLGFSFSDAGAVGQDLGSLVGLGFGEDSVSIARLAIAIVLSGLIVFWAFRSSEFREQKPLVVTSMLLGVFVTLAWYLTAGPGGIELIEEIEFMDEPPYASGAQSLTFIGPLAHISQYVVQDFSMAFLSIGSVAIFGIVVGSFVYTLIFKKIRLEWFVDWADFVRHLIGGFLMGIGGVLAMGCTVGQGVTGVSTLSIGSIIAVVSIIYSCMATMKYQYYRMVYEESSRSDALITTLVEMRLLPTGLRKLESI